MVDVESVSLLDRAELKSDLEEFTCSEGEEESPLVEETAMSKEELKKLIETEEPANKEESEKKKDEPEEDLTPEDPEIAEMSYDAFMKMKDQPDVVVEKYVSEMKRRYKVSERRSKGVEKRLVDIHPANQSIQEDRQEIMGELLDKIDQALDIIDEHSERRIPFGHRVHLEARLLGLMNEKLDIIDNIMDKFHVIGDDKDASLNEREMLRYEIRFLDLMYTGIHEAFLKSYLEMEW